MVKKKLGQHFLIDKDVVQRELTYADITKSDVVLEIGPGMGVLTIPLAKQAKHVVAIEYDHRLYTYLQGIVPKNVELICADAVDVDFSTFPTCTKIVSNLPFQISSPITFKLLGYPFFKKAVLIYQKDFAERMIAKPGNKSYSRLSVGVYYHAKCCILEHIPKHCFSPPPRVDSCIVELIPRKIPPFTVKNEVFFFKIVKQLFEHRRKKIKTTLSKHYVVSLDEIPFGDDRVEMLTPKQIGCLSDWLYLNK